MQKKPARTPQNADDREQSKLFIKKAREIGADEKHSRADDLLKRLVEQERKGKPKRD